MKPLFPEPSSVSETKLPPSCVGTLPGHQELDNWGLIKQELTACMSKKDFAELIAPLQVVQESNNTVVILADKMESYSKLFEGAIELINTKKNSLGLNFLKVEVRLGPAEPPAPALLTRNDPLKDFVARARTPSTKKEKILASSASFLSGLNPDYNFNNFVSGASNQFALATCQGVAESPGTTYNPLFIYGPSGLGKTHLLHAVGNYCLTKSPETRVSYISSERFMNDMILSIRHNKMGDFRRRYRSCDVFLMDDIQFISGNKNATQEEFFHTFNCLYEAKKQIVVTSDMFPQDIPDIEERLRNRFQWGLIADIQPPNIEHRMAILVSKAEQLGSRLGLDVAEFIAKQARRNVRELEGALHRIVAFSALHGRPINLELAFETFQGMEPESKKKVDISTIQALVAEHFALKKADLKSQKRKRSLSLPRQLAMYLVRKHTLTSFPEIGSLFGGKDHSTVLYAVKKISKDLAQDPDLMAHLDAIERKLERT
jgi:chromosomal replication initiator protein